MSLPNDPSGDDGVAYANSKNFSHLTAIEPTEGFWVNIAALATTTTSSTASTSTTTSTTTTAEETTTSTTSSTTTTTLPLILAEGKVVARIDGVITPVAGAKVLLNKQEIATSDHLGLFHYETKGNVIITIQADGFPDRVGMLTASDLRSYFWLEQPEEPPQFGIEAVTLTKPSGETKFREYPNLLIMEATVAISAKPTPKEISDGTASLTITDMALTHDTTVAVTTFTGTEEILKSANLSTLLGGGQTTLIIGGADVDLSDSTGTPTTCQAAGFGGKVRPTLKDKGASLLSAGSKVLTEMQDALKNGTGAISLIYYDGSDWQMAGLGMISLIKDTLAIRSAPGVVMDGLYPFLFIYADKRVVTGQVVSEGKPLANALITMHGADDSTVSAADGSFSLSVPNLLSTVSLTVFHESYYVTQATATFPKGATTTEVEPIALNTLPQVAVVGQVSDQQPAPLAGVEVVLRFAQIPSNIVFPKSITAKTGGDGIYTFPAVPLDLLPGTTVEATAASGYHLTLDQALPTATEDKVTLDFSLVAPLWTYPTNGNLYATPLVAGGSVYFGGVDGWMHKLDAASGAKQWEVDVDNAIFATPVLDSANLYFGTVSNKLMGMNRDTGANAFAPVEINAWGSGNLDIIASPNLVNGTLSFGANDDSLYFFDTTTGSPQNSISSGNNITATAAVANNTLYLGGWNGRLTATPASGDGIYQTKPLWQYPPAAQNPRPARILSTPIVANDKVYFGGGNNLTVSLTDKTGKVTQTSSFNTTSGDNQQTVTFTENVASWTMTFDQEDETLYCLNADNGSLVWDFPLDGSVVGRPAISGDILFISTLAGRITALDISSGKPTIAKWQSAKFGPLYSAPVVANGRVYVGSEDHSLYCLDAASGKTLWSIKTGGAIIASPVVADGKVYAASLDGVLYCLSED